MQLGPTIGVLRITASRGARRLAALAAALVLSTLLVFPAAGVAHAQTPSTEIVLVNADRPVERKKDGRFVARPVFDRRLDGLFYGIKTPGDR